MLDSLFGRAAPKREYPSGQVRPILLNQAGCLSGLASLDSAPFGKRTGGAMRPFAHLTGVKIGGCWPSRRDRSSVGERFRTAWWNNWPRDTRRIFWQVRAWADAGGGQLANFP